MLRNLLCLIVYMRAWEPFASRNENRMLPEKFIHIFQIQALGLW